MKDFDHPNVLTILGICVDAGPIPYVVMPFMSHGCLKSYLKDHGNDLMVLSDESDEDKVSLQTKASHLGRWHIIINYYIAG